MSVHHCNVYEACPVFENDHFLLRLVEEKDTSDLLSVYSDKHALPFFNSDNCHGDNFYYPTYKRMLEAVKFWIFSYEHKYFVRLSIIDKSTSKAIGTIELFHRVADDAFNDVGVLRLDVRSDYETEDILFEIVALIVPFVFELFYCNEVITKAPVYAVERIKAIQKFGFIKSDCFMVGSNDRYPYNGYWTYKNRINS